MSRRAVIVGFVVVFVLGLSLGFNAALLLHRHFVPRPAAGGPPPHGPMFGRPPGPPLEHLVRVLDLSPEQRERIRVHIDRMREHTRAVRDSLRRAIETELTPAQREHWRALQPRHPMDPGMERDPERPEGGPEGEK